MSDPAPERPDTPEWAFPRAVQGALNYRGMSKTELARRMGVTPKHITKLLSREHNPTLKTQHDIADALGMNLTVSFTDPKVPLGKERDNEEGEFEAALRRLVRTAARGPVSPHILQVYENLLERRGSKLCLVAR